MLNDLKNSTSNFILQNKTNKPVYEVPRYLDRLVISKVIIGKASQTTDVWYMYIKFR